MQVERDRSARNPEATFRVPEYIPIFPLPNVVFFPRTSLPLHIFEPRYREMCADANASGQCIGMALLKEGWEQDYYGNPPIFAVGCVGRLAGVHRLPDGRLNIVLQGLQRYEIQEQLYGKSYRQARITLKPSGAGGVLEPSVKSELVRLLTQYLRAREVGDQWREFCRPDVEDEILVNNLSAYLDFTPLEKQFLLEAESLLQQARRLSDLIRFKIHEWEGAGGWG